MQNRDNTTRRGDTTITDITLDYIKRLAEGKPNEEDINTQKQLQEASERSEACEIYETPQGQLLHKSQISEFETLLKSGNLKKYWPSSEADLDKLIAAAEKNPTLKTAAQVYKSLAINLFNERHDKTQQATSQIQKFIDELKQTILDINNPLSVMQNFHTKNPFFYDKNNLFWAWNTEDKMWVMFDEVDLMNRIAQNYDIQKLISSKTRNEYVEAAKRVGRLNIPKPAQKTWLQFKNTIVDLNTGTEFPATPEYFFTNPIPWDIGTTEDTPTIDTIFGQWVGQTYTPALYEIIAYCTLPDYPLHRAFCLVGSGSNGKGKYSELLTRFVGPHNRCSSELDRLLTNRFEPAKLYRKLVCLIGETNYVALKQTSLLKRLTGGDTIGFELKGKNPFDDYSYAKIIISTNSLPVTYDKTRGFYRRFFIIPFENEFSEAKDVLQDIPEVEYSNLARKVIRLLKEILTRRTFTGDGTIEDREATYEAYSNPFKKFVAELYNTSDPSAFMLFGDLYDDYTAYLNERGHRKITNIEFGKIVEGGGLVKKKTTVGGITSVRVYGIQYPITKVTKITYLPTHQKPLYTRSETPVIPVISGIVNSKLQTYASFDGPFSEPHGLVEGIPSKCVLCGVERCFYQHKVTFKLYCPSCAESVEKGWEVAK